MFNHSYGEEFFSGDKLDLFLFQLLFSNICPPFIAQSWEHTDSVSPISSPLERTLSPNLPTPSSKHLWRNGIQSLMQVFWELPTRRSETKDCVHWPSVSHTALRDPAADVLSWRLCQWKISSYLRPAGNREQIFKGDLPKSSVHSLSQASAYSSHSVGFKNRAFSSHCLPGIACLLLMRCWTSHCIWLSYASGVVPKQINRNTAWIWSWKDSNSPPILLY